MTLSANALNDYFFVFVYIPYLVLKSFVKRIFALIFSWCLLFLDLIFQIFYRLV